MTVKIIDRLDDCVFNDLGQGEAFLHLGELYLKTDYASAVLLVKGEQWEFDDFEPVFPVTIEVRIAS